MAELEGWVTDAAIEAVRYMVCRSSSFTVSTSPVATEYNIVEEETTHISDSDRRKCPLLARCPDFGGSNVHKQGV